MWRSMWRLDAALDVALDAAARCGGSVRVGALLSVAVAVRGGRARERIPVVSDFS
jgi:hypothetical protein